MKRFVAGGVIGFVLRASVVANANITKTYWQQETEIRFRIGYVLGMIESAGLFALMDDIARNQNQRLDIRAVTSGVVNCLQPTMTMVGHCGNCRWRSSHASSG